MQPMRIKSAEFTDRAFHLRQLQAWFDDKAKQYPGTEENRKRFVNKILKLFTDNSPDSWRFKVTTYKHAVFRVHYKPTGRDNDFLVVGSNNLIMIHRFFDESFRRLFPEGHIYYGHGHEAKIDYSRFGEKEQKEYMDAITSMATTHPDWYIRRLAKK
jgi:hypothetical protein